MLGEGGEKKSTFSGAIRFDADSYKHWAARNPHNTLRCLEKHPLVKHSYAQHPQLEQCIKVTARGRFWKWILPNKWFPQSHSEQRGALAIRQEFSPPALCSAQQPSRCLCVRYSCHLPTLERSVQERAFLGTSLQLRVTNATMFYWAYPIPPALPEGAEWPSFYIFGISTE